MSLIRILRVLLNNHILFLLQDEYKKEWEVCVGREKFGHAFLADTGTSNGDITGQVRQGPKF